MTLERPAYRVTVENVDEGWTQTIEHRETPPDRDDVEAILIDPLTMAWSFAGGITPAPLDPDTVTFKLWVKSVEFMPAISAGDIIKVDLDRPGPADELIPYMHFVGRATDPDAEVRPGKGITLTVTATSLDTDLQQDVAFSSTDFTSDLTAEYALSVYGSEYSRASFAIHDPLQFARRTYPYGSMTLGEAFDRIAAGATDSAGTFVGVVRSAYGWEPDPAQWNELYPYDDPDAQITYYLEKFRVGLPAALTLVEDDVDADMVVLGPSDEAVERIATLSARFVDVPATWRKDREDIVNRVEITGVKSSGGAPISPLTEHRSSRSDAASVLRFGPATREVNTFVMQSSMPDVAGAYLKASPSVTQWSIPAVTVQTKLMDDDELDQLASVFYPHVEPNPGVLDRVFVLTDLDPDTAIAGDAVAVQSAGATFSISRGDLTIALNLRTLPPADFSTSITFDELAASPLADTTFVDTGAGHYIDPALDIDELTFSDI